MKLAAAIALLTGALAAPVSATEWINCASTGGEASMDMLVGATGVLSIVGLNISHGDDVWASETAYGPGAPVSVGQAFEDAETMRVDAMDEAFAKLAELRLFKTEDLDGAPVLAGTLRITDRGAWAVSCSGP